MFEFFLEAVFQRLDEIAIDERENGIERFDDGDRRAEGGINHADFQADVAAADDEQALGYVGQ